MNKNLEIIIIINIIFIGLVILFKRSDNYKEIYVDVIEPSNAKIVFNPILGDNIEIKQGDFFTININSDIKDFKIIDTNNILKVENNKISAESIGKTEIYVISSDKKIKSNIFTINVIK